MRYCRDCHKAETEVEFYASARSLRCKECYSLNQMNQRIKRRGFERLPNPNKRKPITVNHDMNPCTVLLR